MYAAIDIGSNAGRLLLSTVAEFNGVAFTNKVSLVRVPLRLGLDVFEKGHITDEKVEFLLKTFDAYQKLLNVYQPIDIAACGTAAMREASNAQQIVELVKKKTGFELMLIDGLKEAKIISASENSNVMKPHEHSLYIDVGGGSTELAWYKKEELIAAKSFNIGTIRFLLDQINNDTWNGLKDWMKNFNPDELEFNCICSGGNINKLTKLYGNRERNTLTYSQLADAHIYLEGYSVEDRMKELGFREDRADVIVPASIIFKKIMKWGKVQELQAPKIGLADGLIVDLYRKHKGQPTIIV